MIDAICYGTAVQITPTSIFSRIVSIWVICPQIVSESNKTTFSQKKSCICMFSGEKSLLVITHCGQVAQNGWVTSAREMHTEFTLGKLSTSLAGKAQPYSDMLILQGNSGNHSWNSNSVGIQTPIALSDTTSLLVAFIWAFQKTN